MGSSAHVIVVGGHPTLASRARRRLAALEQAWSRFIPDSEVSRSTGPRASQSPCRLTPACLVRRALAGHRFTGGRFDPTVLPAVIAAGYDRSFDSIPVAPATTLGIVAGTGGHRGRRRRGHRPPSVRRRVRSGRHRQGARGRPRGERARRARCRWRVCQRRRRPARDRRGARRRRVERRGRRPPRRASARHRPTHRRRGGHELSSSAPLDERGRHRAPPPDRAAHGHQLVVGGARRHRCGIGRLAGRGAGQGRLPRRVEPVGVLGAAMARAARSRRARR